MQYIVEVPEERLPELAAAISGINPQALPPIPVSRNADGLTSNMEYVEDYYRSELQDELQDELQEEKRPGKKKRGNRQGARTGTSSASRPGWESAPSWPDVPNGTSPTTTGWTPPRSPRRSDSSFRKTPFRRTPS